MIPTDFPESNCNFGPPEGFDESQIGTVRAHRCSAKGGSMDGVPLTVVAWKPLPHELDALKSGQPVFLTVLGCLPPHFLSTDFHSATHPA